jgi:hypothetical protein
MPQLTQHDNHRDIAEQLLATDLDGYPNLATQQLLTALVHAVLAVADARAE